jgi:translocation and assembly module TamB
MNAPMLIQIYAAQPTLWRLSEDKFGLSGPIAVGADLSGRLVDPQIEIAQGRRPAEGSAVIGTVISSRRGRFAVGGVERNQRIDARGGTIAGSGTVDFSGGGGGWT